jgi:hypothetical protein
VPGWGLGAQDCVVEAGVINPPVYNDASFRQQFPAFASTAAYPPGALQFAWNMGGNWVNQQQGASASSIPIIGEVVGVGTGATATFAHTVANLPVVPGTVTITAGAVVATDNGQGGLSGTGVVAGTVNYLTGVVSVTYSADPTVALPITMAYSYYGGSPWLAPWCSGLRMNAQQLQQAADLMGAVLTYQLYGPASGSSQTPSQDGEAPGAVQSATEGSVTATFQLPEIRSSAFSSMLLASPPYGRMLLALLQVAGSVGAYIRSGRPAWIPP